MCVGESKKEREGRGRGKHVTDFSDLGVKNLQLILSNHQDIIYRSILLFYINNNSYCILLIQL